MLSKEYDPTTYEKRIYKMWEEAGAFEGELGTSKKSYTIVIPPPNVTGILHIGHALNNTLQDILIRWNRMKGNNAFWLPGTDHAGIATQNVMEKRLKIQGTSRFELGREKFLEKVWELVEEHRGTILNQLKRLGCSCDWKRLRFTLDDGLSKAVRTVFVKLFKKGLIYRGDYIINLDPGTQSAISDDEVNYEEYNGHLYYVKYPLKNAESLGITHLVVATTRPETMLGDTAVAVNPKDERFKKLVGETCILPIANRELPIIADDFVDPEFGTGAVKVTPSHDPNDFEIAGRHDLEKIIIMKPDGTMNENAFHFNGMNRFDCREALLKELKEKQFIEKIEPYKYRVGYCYRSNEMIEPYQSLQWFVKMKPLAAPALKAAQDGRLRFHPDRWTKVYINWLADVRDWCISRQLWWGHRIPVWYCRDCGHIDAYIEDPTNCSKCNSENIYQDSDVLDTWFSSWLWPFSTMGWPEETDLMKTFYPTQDMITAPDIIFFWVARMVMAGIEFTGELPFSDVYLHGIIRDAEFRKMSKSLGNIIDPFDVIEGRFTHIFQDQDMKNRPYGADALRLSLILITVQGQDLSLSMEKLDIGGNFANKLWNAARLVLSNLEGYQDGFPSTDELQPFDKWILTRVNEVARDVAKGFKNYNFNESASTLYNFFWFEFCDWYLEMVKNSLWGNKGENERRIAQQVAVYVLDRTIRLLHPIMPFITEEIWQKLPVAEGLLIRADWPEYSEKEVYPEDCRKMELAIDIVRKTRNIRSENDIKPNVKIPLMLVAKNDAIRESLSALEKEILFLGNLSELKIDASVAKPKFVATASIGKVELFIPLEGLVDVDAERARLGGEIAKTDKEIMFFNKKLSNKNYIQKAPTELVEKDKEKLASNEAEKAKLVKALARLPKE